MSGLSVFRIGGAVLFPAAPCLMGVKLRTEIFHFGGQTVSIPYIIVFKV